MFVNCRPLLLYAVFQFARRKITPARSLIRIAVIINIVSRLVMDLSEKTVTLFRIMLFINSLTLQPPFFEWMKANITNLHRIGTP